MNIDKKKTKCVSALTYSVFSYSSSVGMNFSIKQTKNPHDRH